jgi:hypothetical protein
MSKSLVMETGIEVATECLAGRVPIPTAIPISIPDGEEPAAP